MADFEYNRKNKKHESHNQSLSRFTPNALPSSVPDIMTPDLSTFVGDNLPALSTSDIPKIAGTEAFSHIEAVDKPGINLHKYLNNDSVSSKIPDEKEDEEEEKQMNSESRKDREKFSIHNLRLPPFGKKTSMALPIFCDICDKVFQHKASLSLHLRTHTGYKPHVCKECGKAFSQIGSLQQHVRLHTGDRPYKCQTCNKDFAQLNGLNQHVRIHSGEQPYQCSVCSKRFSQNGSLKSHMRTHSGDKPFICMECGKGFSQTGSLIAHRRTHSADKPFKCDLCPKMFTQKIGLQNHQKTAHNIQVQTNSFSDFKYTDS